MTLIDLINQILSSISNMLNRTFIVSWMRRHIVLANMAILIFIIVTFFNIATLAESITFKQNYPDGEFGLRKIDKDNMESVCYNEDYSSKQLQKTYSKNILQTKIIEFDGLELKNTENTFNAYKWVCRYKLENKNNIKNNPNGIKKLNEGIVRDNNTGTIGLDLDTYYCKKNGKTDRAIFLYYKDENSWFCITDPQKP